MNIPPKSITVVLATVFFCISSTAQTDSLSAPRVEQLVKQPLTVSVDLMVPLEISEKRLSGFGSSAGRNVQLITAKELEQLPVKTFNEALMYVSGVDMRQRGPLGAQADLSIQGSTFEQVLILINGIPMRDPQTGHHQLNLPIELRNIAHIEILKGSAARIYGANAMAGAINIVTKNPLYQPSTYVETFVGANFETDTASGDQYYAYGVKAGAGFKTGRFGHQIDLSHLNSNGYRYNSYTEQSRVNYQGNLEINGNGMLTIMSGALINDFGASLFYAAPYDNNAVEKVTTTYNALNYRHRLGAWRINSNAYWRYNHDDYIYLKDNPSFYRNNHFGNSAGAELHVNRTLANNDIIGGGYEFRNEMIRSNNLGSFDRSYHALYVDYRMYLQNGMILTAGANAQYNTDYGWKIYPGVEFSTKIIRSVRGFVNAGLSNRLPSYTDLYYDGPSNIGNPDLQPENAYHVEGGFKSQDQTLKWQVSGFVRDMDNFIDFVRDSVQAQFQPRNFQHVRVQGVDASVSHHFPKLLHLPVTPTMVRIGYTYLDASLLNDDLESKYALEHLRHQLVGQVVVKTGKKFHHTITMRYNERFLSEEYGVMDYRLTFRHNKLSATVDVTNIFDRTYKEIGSIPMPGRWYRLGLAYDFK